MTEQPTNENGQPICSPNCGRWEYSDSFWRDWNGLVEIMRQGWCQSCGARLNPDGTSGPSAADTAEWLKLIHVTPQMMGLYHDSPKILQAYRIGYRFAISDVADHLGIEWEESNDMNEQTINAERFAEWLQNRYAAITQELAEMPVYIKYDHHENRLVGQQQALEAVADHIGIELEADDEPDND